VNTTAVVKPSGGCRTGLARSAGQPPALRAAPFVKGEYCRELGIVPEEAEDDEYEGSNLQQRAAAPLPAQSKCNLSGL